MRAGAESCLDVRIRDRGAAPVPRADSPGSASASGSSIAHETDGFEIRAVPEGGTELLLRFAL